MFLRAPHGLDAVLGTWERLYRSVEQVGIQCWADSRSDVIFCVLPPNLCVSLCYRLLGVNVFLQLCTQTPQSLKPHPTPGSRMRRNKGLLPSDRPKGHLWFAQAAASEQKPAWKKKPTRRTNRSRLLKFSEWMAAQRGSALLQCRNL